MLIKNIKSKGFKITELDTTDKANVHLINEVEIDCEF